MIKEAKANYLEKCPDSDVVANYSLFLMPPSPPLHHKLFLLRYCK